MVDLGTLGGTYAYPSDINSRGQVVGWAQTAAGTNHAFMWDDGVLTDLGALAGDESRAFAINNAGLIVGDSVDIVGDPEDPVGLLRPVKWDDGVLIELPTLDPDLAGTAYDINEKGTVVGRTTIVSEP